MTLAEGSSLHIFAGRAYGDSILENRCQRQFLGGGPIHRGLIEIVQNGPATLPSAPDLPMGLETIGKSDEGLVEAAQAMDGHGGHDIPGASDRSGCGCRGIQGSRWTEVREHTHQPETRICGFRYPLKTVVAVVREGVCRRFNFN